MYFAIKVGSVTNAQRGAKALRNKGYKSSVGRIENPGRNDGCGYAINVYSSNKEDVVQILHSIGVSVLGVEAR